MKFLDPMIIPNYGCASFNSRGERCTGDKTVMDKKYGCKKCLCLDVKTYNQLIYIGNV